MPRQSLIKRARLVLPLTMLMALALACNLGAQSPDAAQITATALGSTAVAQSNVPEVEIQSPADNSEAVVNTEVQVYVRATDQTGVTRIEMRVDNLIVDTSASPDPNGSPTLASILSWTPNASGPHVLQIVAFRGSVQGNPKNLTITVVDTAAQVTVPAGSPQALTASPTTNPFCNVRANVDGLNVRSGPGINYDVITSLKLGQLVPISGSNADRSWWQINLSGQVGWVSASYSSTTGVCDNIIVVPEPPSPTVPVGATPIFIPPSFTPLPVIPSPVPPPTIRVVVLNTLTFTPGPSGPSSIQLTATQVLATQTALAIPTLTASVTPAIAQPTATPTNTATVTATPVLPNLVVSGISVPNNVVIFDPSKPVAVAQLTVTVANTGDGPAGLFRVTVQLPDGSLATGTTIAPLAPHTQVDVPITAYIAHAGDTLLKVIADYDNVIPETNKSDNVLSYTLNVVQATAVPNAPTATPTLTYTPPPTSTNTSTPTNTATLVPTGVTLPNLVIRGIQINPDPGVILKGTTTGNIQVVVRVANIGNGPAGTFLIGLALSDGRQVAAQAPALNPGKETNVTLTVPFTQPGQYHLLATADSGNTITETSKADNAFARDILIQDQNANVPTVTATITSTPQQVISLPDLAITNVQIAKGAGPLAVTAGVKTAANVLVTITNVGNGDAPPFQVAVIFPNGQQFTGGTSQTLPGKVNAQAIVTVPITITQAGKLKLTVLVNPGNVIVDAKTGTKSMALSVDVSGANAPTNTVVPTAAPVVLTATPTQITPTLTLTATSTVKAAASVTATNTATHTPTPGAVAPPATATLTATVAQTVTRTVTGTNTATMTHTVTPGASVTAVAATTTPTNTATHTSTPSAVPGVVVPTLTNTATHTTTPVPVAALPTATPTHTFTPIPATATATHTFTPIPATPTATHIFTPIPATPTATHTFTPIPATPTATHTFTPIPATATATHTFTPIPPTPTATHTFTPIPATATATHTFTPIPPTPTATHTFTPIPATATATHTFTPIPPTATATATIPPTAVPVQPPNPGTPPDFLKLPVIPNLAGDQPVLANLQAISAKAKAIPPGIFVVVGDPLLTGIKDLKPDQLQLEASEKALSDSAKFFAASIPVVGSIPTTSATLTAAGLLDPAKSEGACKAANKAPLTCALENTGATVVFISVGSADVAQNTPADVFQKALEDAVNAAIAHNVIPVLITIPGVANPADEPKLAAYNTIIYNVAKVSNVPLLNLYRSLREGNANPPLIVNGVLSTGGTAPGSNFTAEGLKFGVNVANRDLLRTLEQLKKTVIAP